MGCISFSSFENIGFNWIFRDVRKYLSFYILINKGSNNASEKWKISNIGVGNDQWIAKVIAFQIVRKFFDRPGSKSDVGWV